MLADQRFLPKDLELIQLMEDNRMNTETKCFLEALLGFYPEAGEQYEKTKIEYGCVLVTVAMEEVFVPLIIDTIRREENAEFIKRLFELFERTANSSDQHLIDVFSTTILECLGNDADILRKARKYMGHATYELQLEADRRLGRILSCFGNKEKGEK